LAMVSMTARQRIFTSAGPYAFSVQGMVSRRVGGLLPDPGCATHCLQTFLYDPSADAPRDPEVELQHRLTAIPHPTVINRRILLELQEMLHQCNPFVQRLQLCLETAADWEHSTFNIRIVDNYDAMAISATTPPAVGPYTDHPAHRGTLNPPTVNQMACFLFGEDGAISRRDMVLNHRANGPPEFINDGHASYDPLMYVLFFPLGNPGWCISASMRGGPIVPTDNPKISPRDWYKYQFQERLLPAPIDESLLDGTEELPVWQQPRVFNPILYGRRLLQQYMVDQWAKAESDKLLYARTHQSILHSETFRETVNALQRTAGPLGTPHIRLPATFVGSPKDLFKRYHDAVAVLRQVFCALLGIYEPCCDITSRGGLYSTTHIDHVTSAHL
jgi:hypothetical protein